ncbi:MAG: CDP-glycerol glycerophosphotransferase family protein, partial [Pisciglobus halotolerans]|nr:CDP-glycerol glycerophosphotransferase family protein [Pisciglobus halotolerans]
YPSRSPLAIEFIRAKHVLMNQSILGLNNQNQLLGYQTKLFRNDLLLVSSKTEARYVHQTLGYPEKQIKRTGLPKFDKLLMPTKPNKLKRRLLLLPEKIKTGPYNPRNEAGQSAERFLSLLNDDRFNQFIAKHELEIAIVLPSSLDPFAAAFAVTEAQIFFEEETDLFDLFKTSLLLITDTDPRAFDFVFLEKPILFYQPETTSQVFSSSVSLRQTFSNELPGEVAATKEDLLHLLDLLAENHFIISRKNRQKMDALLENHDTDSAERVVQAVQLIAK